MKLTKKQQLTLEVIQRNPGCQDDEHRLLERYWIEVDKWDETKSLYWNLQRMTHAETISRARRRLHELGLIEYSDNALKTRTKAYRQDVNRYSNHESVKAEIVKPKIIRTTDGELVTVL